MVPYLIEVKAELDDSVKTQDSFTLRLFIIDPEDTTCEDYPYMCAIDEEILAECEAALILSSVPSQQIKTFFSNTPLITVEWPEFSLSSEEDCGELKIIPRKAQMLDSQPVEYQQSETDEENLLWRVVPPATTDTLDTTTTI